MAKAPKTEVKGVTVFFATNRDHLDGGFAMDAAFGQERRLTLGTVQVEPNGDAIATEAARGLLAPPEKAGKDDFANGEMGPCAKVLDVWLAAASQPDSVALLFIHGFSNAFTDAMTRAAQIVDFYAAEGLRVVPLAFSWPSDGKVLSRNAFGNPIVGAIDQYRRDQEDAAASGPALARLLAEIRRARARQKGASAKATRLGLLAHSMGNHALANGLLSLNNGLMTAQMRNLFHHAVLAAADVSSASFATGRSLRLIADLAGAVTVGISFDTTLSLLSNIANGNARLGHSGPDELSNLPANIQVVDYFFGLEQAREERLRGFGNCTTYDTVQHQWYRNDTNARRDIAMLFAGKLPLKRTILDTGQQTVAERTRHALFA